MPDGLFIDPEIILFSVALLLYLQDLAHLLYPSDVAFYKSGNGIWQAKPGNRFPDFARRYLALVRPWRPATVVSLASWPRPMVGDTQAIAAQVDSVQQRLSFLKHQVGPLACSIFVVLPALYIGIGPVSFLIGVTIVYLQVLTMLVTVVLNRRRIGLSGRETALLAFESLICVPYAINAYRKLARKMMPSGIDPTELADALLAPESARALRQQLLEVVDLRVSLLGDDLARSKRLESYRKERLEPGLK